MWHDPIGDSPKPNVQVLVQLRNGEYRIGTCEHGDWVMWGEPSVIYGARNIRRWRLMDIGKS